MDVVEKLKKLNQEKNWTEYRLSKESGIAPTTIANIFHHDTIPSISTLERLCDAYGITLSQFFAENNLVSLSEDQKKILSEWAHLNDNQKRKLIDFLQANRE